jgi:hypothetical protein
MTEETEWIFNMIGDFCDAIREFGVKKVMSELPDETYDALKYYFVKNENASTS